VFGLHRRPASNNRQDLNLAATSCQGAASPPRVSGLHVAAEETIRNHQVIELTGRDTAILVQALSNPPEPNEALREALRLDRECFGE